MVDGPEIHAADPAVQGPVNEPVNPFLDDLVNTHAATPKQQYDIPEPPKEETAAPSGDENPSANSAGPNHDPDVIMKQARAHVELFDFISSRGLSAYSSEPSEKFKASDTEKTDLTKALADYYATLESPPQMPPWVMLLVVASMIYGPKMMTARQIRRAKKKAEKETKANEDRFENPIPFPPRKTTMKVEVDNAQVINEESSKTTAAPAEETPVAESK